jgi:hypothetical protein
LPSRGMTSPPAGTCSFIPLLMKTPIAHLQPEPSGPSQRPPQRLDVDAEQGSGPALFSFPSPINALARSSL